MKMLNADDQSKLAELLTEALKSARLEQFSAGFPNDRILVKNVHSGGIPCTDIREGDVMHPTNYIRNAMALYLGSWVLSPLGRAMEMLGIPVPAKADPSTLPDANIPTERAEPAPAVYGEVVDAEFVPPKPHPHAATIREWLEDTTRDIWGWSPDLKRWQRVGIDYPISYPQHQYTIGQKPTQPPRRMCTLAGVEFPAPQSDMPRDGLTVYIADWSKNGGTAYQWECGATDLRLLESGFIHLTREAAEAHGRALQAATKQAIEAAR